MSGMPTMSAVTSKRPSRLRLAQSVRCVAFAVQSGVARLAAYRCHQRHEIARIGIPLSRIAMFRKSERSAID